MLGRSRSATLALVAGLLGAVSAGAVAQPTPTVVAAPAKAKRKGLFDSGVYVAPYRKLNYGGPGTTAAQIKRASRKVKNVKRHKARG